MSYDSKQNVYSFKLHPEQHQPSGTCNYSKIDSFELKIDYVHLDTTEKRRFAQTGHEYLIDQLQHEYFTNKINISITDLHANNKDNNCIICFDSLSNSVYKCNVCSYAYHISCTHSMKSLNCPNCRTKISYNDTVYDINEDDIDDDIDEDDIDENDGNKDDIDNDIEDDIGIIEI